uniref:Uncharacterized protein n=1 Tax=candidate division CPR3 bacterium TaxID=2268181 RepID=A0A7V3JAE5_UNCC3
MSRLDELKFQIKKLEYYKKHNPVNNVKRFNDDAIEAVHQYNLELKKQKREKDIKALTDDIQSETKSYLRNKGIGLPKAGSKLYVYNKEKGKLEEVR